METLFPCKCSVGNVVANGHVVGKAAPFFWHTSKKLPAPTTV
jgi:hypothetical protein